MRDQPERTIHSCVAEAQTRLQQVGIESASLDAQLLLAFVMGTSREHVWMYPREIVPKALCADYEAVVTRREAREPLAYIVGTKEFFSHSYDVSPAVLIPRPDSEWLVETCLALKTSRKGKVTRIADMGTGSGCLLLSVLHDWPEATGLGVDVSEAALAVAENNARKLNLRERVTWCHSHWDAHWPDNWDRVDVMISNPPYIDPNDRPGLAPELNYEPEGALTAAADGLAAYQALAELAPRRLHAGGVLMLELGAGQEADVRHIMQQAGLRVTQIVTDLAGHARVLVAQRVTDNGKAYDASEAKTVQ